jgi:hypothetical protein
MTAINRTPTNPNFLQPNKFLLNFSRAPNIQYFCQSVSVPGISLSEAVLVNPLVDIYSPGEKAIYDLLNITFFDEYKQLPKLNRIAGYKQNFPQFSDATVTLLSSSNKEYYRFKFRNCFPTTLSTFIMNASDSPDTIITADATFRYEYYDIEKLF